MYNRLTRILLGIATCLVLMATGMGAVHAGMLVNNTAELNYADNLHRYFPTVRDTAAISVISPPNIAINKDVRNMRTGETSSDIVTALRSDTVEFILYFINTGEATATYVIMSDAVPTGTVYVAGSASDTNNLDPVNPPDTVTFQHTAGGPYDQNDTGTVTAIRWHWNKMSGIIDGNNSRITKFRVKVQ